MHNKDTAGYVSADEITTEYTKIESTWDADKRDVTIYLHNDKRDAVAVVAEPENGAHELVAKVDLAVLLDGVYVRMGYGDPSVVETMLYALRDDYDVKMAMPPELAEVKNE
ncbi:TPA: hypothetical protein JG871_003945 [Enterobacter hormaechei subsp. xiangfangensis]|nr:hypothetical protein [Enterobacter hormaechei subsp. xiangfangensis]